MFNYKMILEYEGTRYNGWQKNKNAPNTIQDLLEREIGLIVGEEVEVNGSGRTDAGVHAKAQCANFKSTKEFKTKTLMEAINYRLPSDIKVLSLEQVNERFHSRLNAKAKTYKYTIDISKKPDVFSRRYIEHCPCILDFKEIEKAIKHIKGEKDFKAFSSVKKTKKSTVRTIYSIDIEIKGTEISFIYRGNGFLHNMVRILTGTLIYVGMGKIKAKDIDKIILSKDRSLAGKTMSPRGLMLLNVEYD
ncbi:MAG: tRNA pseudouridine(38-40) synthase TruA [Lachnospirales bacterium]